MAGILSIILYFLLKWQALRMYAFRWRDLRNYILIFDRQAEAF